MYLHFCDDLFYWHLFRALFHVCKCLVVPNPKNHAILETLIQIRVLRASLIRGWVIINDQRVCINLILIHLMPYNAFFKYTYIRSQKHTFIAIVYLRSILHQMPVV
ncbi:hypothetical protein GDO78_008414 [Eleutherodactylus coqui]|uniref:Uncharacterized protein n=1 Tax=Eleutherodactylus coqui TaxID=57060 RepID=A0A8J6KA11_ELECQ|nr:hypothetical protein GDO78_008414 [Eleutherodactylus coqui]